MCICGDFHTLCVGDILASLESLNFPDPHLRFGIVYACNYKWSHSNKLITHHRPNKHTVLIFQQHALYTFPADIVSDGHLGASRTTIIQLRLRHESPAATTQLVVHLCHYRWQ